jgi:hypothetical protein
VAARAAQVGREALDPEDLELALGVLAVVRPAHPDSVAAVASAAAALAADVAGSAVLVEVALEDVVAGVLVEEIGPDAAGTQMLLVDPAHFSAIDATGDSRPFAEWFSCHFAIQPWTHGHSR